MTAIDPKQTLGILQNSLNLRRIADEYYAKAASTNCSTSAAAAQASGGIVK
jgi:hypothetical protein